MRPLRLLSRLMTKPLGVSAFSGRETFTGRLPNWDITSQKNIGAEG